MRLSAAQAYVNTQLLANATLAAFGAPIVASLENDETTIKELIDTRLRDPGVCIEIGEVTGSFISELHPGGYSKLRAQIDVFVAEKIASPTHTPRGLELVELIVGAITSGRHTADWTGHDSAVLENGYSLQVLSFSIPVTVTK